MKYLLVSEADRPIKCQCNGELYLALAMENLSLTDGYQVQPVPWRQSVNARDAGRLKSQFMRSAKLPIRDGAAGSPQVCNRPNAAAGTAAGMGAKRWIGTIRPFPASIELANGNVKEASISRKAPPWLMRPWLTADLPIFYPPLFANFFAFLARFDDSRIRLNIRASFKLTNRGRACSLETSWILNDLRKNAVI